MKIRTLKQSLEHLSRYIPMAHPATGWYVAEEMPDTCIQPDSKNWSCIFSCFHQLLDGHRICFSSDRAGCSGAACYFGYKAPSRDAGRFLAEHEKFKKSAALGNAFYDHVNAPDTGSRVMVWETAVTVDDTAVVDVINLWIEADVLPDLVTLANFDRSSNDNAVIPFASGCQSVWTLPYKEKYAEKPRCVVGCMDPAMRKYLPGGVFSFSMPAERIIEIADHVSDSFLAISDKNP